MNNLSAESLAAYWSTPAMEANLIIVLNLIGALALGGAEASKYVRSVDQRRF